MADIGPQSGAILVIVAIIGLAIIASIGALLFLGLRAVWEMPMDRSKRDNNAPQHSHSDLGWGRPETGAKADIAKDPLDNRQPLVRHVAHWLVLIAAIVFGGTFILGGAVAMLLNADVWKIATKHFAGTVGLPAAAFAAMCIVIFLENSAGRIEFEGLGFKFKGASGPIVLWVLCFLAIVAGIKLLY